MLLQWLTDVDTDCEHFCREVRPVDGSDAHARRAQLRKSQSWLESRFGTGETSADWNTPTKFSQDTPAPKMRRTSGAKRKQEFAPCWPASNFSEL
jgi:hypothetical protein